MPKSTSRKLRRIWKKRKRKYLCLVQLRVSLFLLYTLCFILQLKGLEEAPEKCQKDIEEATDQIEVLEVLEVLVLPCIVYAITII